MSLISKILAKFGYVKKDFFIDSFIEKLNYARTVEKRLDEHRELVQSLEKTFFFKAYPWHIGHMATQDDYLMRLYHMVHGFYPENIPEKYPKKRPVVRPRPEILGECDLPEFKKTLKNNKE